ncbi:MAG: Nudix family hydrolase [Gammaproteobacteria bacterium]|nr:Nudix family hydrolase [Gammaproteobacteria bacterium]NND59542.1 Nudix family hydrolase [Gammaproteobacteria bacterium]
MHVVAGVLCDDRDRVLIAQRPAGKHMAGKWEFPGGKLHPGEDPRTGLERELREELGIDARVCEPLIRCRHRYPERTVLLDVWRVSHYEGIPVGLEGQALRWLEQAQLVDADILPADRPILAALQLPPFYVISPVLDSAHDFVTGMPTDESLVQLRQPQLHQDELRRFVESVAALTTMDRVIINGAPQTTIELARDVGAAGVHLPSRYLDAPVPSHADLLIGASCHDSEELERAVAIGADFAVLGPVQSTPSHADAVPLGWTRFAALADQANLPVYALGGVVRTDIQRATKAGAQGVAGISAFWPT